MKVLSIISVISSSLNLTSSSYKITCTGDISNHLLQWFPWLLMHSCWTLQSSIYNWITLVSSIRELLRFQSFGSCHICLHYSSQFDCEFIHSSITLTSTMPACNKKNGRAAFRCTHLQLIKINNFVRSASGNLWCNYVYNAFDKIHVSVCIMQKHIQIILYDCYLYNLVFNKIRHCNRFWDSDTGPFYYAVIYWCPLSNGGGISMQLIAA